MGSARTWWLRIIMTIFSSRRWTRNEPSRSCGTCRRRQWRPWSGLRGHPRRSHLEPGLHDLAILRFVDRDHVDLAGAVREAAGDRLLIDHQVTDGDVLDELAKQSRFLEPVDVAIANRRGT